MQIYAINTNKHPAKIWKQFVTQKSLWLPLPVLVCMCVRAWACRGKQTTSRKLKSKHKWHMQSEENGTVAKMNIKKRKEKKESLQMIMKMPSQSLNWPSNKWRASGWEEDEREGSCGAPCKNQSHRKLKVICLLKHPRQNQSGGCHLKCETHAKTGGRL